MDAADLAYSEKSAREWFARESYYGTEEDCESWVAYVRAEALSADSLDFSLRALYNVWLEIIYEAVSAEVVDS